MQVKKKGWSPDFTFYDNGWFGKGTNVYCGGDGGVQI